MEMKKITLALAAAAALSAGTAQAAPQYFMMVQVKGVTATPPSPSYTLAEREAAWSAYAPNTADWNVLTDPAGTDIAPVEPYPTLNPAGDLIDSGIIGSGTPIVTDIGGLSSIETVGGNFIFPFRNSGPAPTALTSVGSDIEIGLVNGDLSWAGNLTTVGGKFWLQGKGVKDISGLSSLTNVGNLRMDGNPDLVDLSPLSGIISAGAVMLDGDISTRTGFTPIPTGSWLCDSANASVFSGSYNPTYAIQADVCQTVN